MKEKTNKHFSNLNSDHKPRGKCNVKRCAVEKEIMSVSGRKNIKSTVKFNLISVVYHLVLKSVLVNTTGTEIMKDFFFTQLLQRRLDFVSIYKNVSIKAFQFTQKVYSCSKGCKAQTTLKP